MPELARKESIVSQMAQARKAASLFIRSFYALFIKKGRKFKDQRNKVLLFQRIALFDFMNCPEKYGTIRLKKQTFSRPFQKHCYSYPEVSLICGLVRASSHLINVVSGHSGPKVSGFLCVCVLLLESSLSHQALHPQHLEISLPAAAHEFPKKTRVLSPESLIRFQTKKAIAICTTRAKKLPLFFWAHPYPVGSISVPS